MRHIVPSLALIITAVPVFAAESPPDLDPADEVIVITASRSPQPVSSTVTPITVVAEDSERLAFPIQPVEALGRRVNGAYSRRSGGPGALQSLRLRGAASDGTQVLYDGVPLNDPSSSQSSPNLAGLNSAAIASAEVARGPQSGLYGSRAIGGVVNLMPITSTEDHAARAVLQGGSYATVDGVAQATGPIGERFGYAIGLSGTASEGWSSRTDDPNGDPGEYEKDGFQRLGGYARFDLAATDAVELYASINATQAENEYDLLAAFPGGPLPDSEATEDSSAIRYQAGGVYADEQLRAEAVVAYTDLEREYPEETVYDRNFNSQELYASANVSWIVEDVWTVAGGIDHIREQADTVSGADGSTTFDEDSNRTGLWVRGAYDEDGWLGSATARYENHDREGDAMTWRLEGARRIGHAVKLFTSVGTAFRAPSLYELYSSYGDPDLEAEESWGFELGHLSHVDDHWTVENTFFSTRYSQRIAFGALYTYENSDRSERVDGLETEIAFMSDPGEVATRMAVRYTYQQPGDDVVQGFSDLANYLPTHQLNADWVVALPRGVTCGLYGTGVAGRQYFGTSVGNYALLDAMVSWQATNTINLFVRGENLMDVDYVETLGYATPGVSGFAGVAAEF
ncbi:MAG: TonB-dependent receptor [Planctomycetota bacterium]|jgi:vitamin B12 transporter|nr:TonB-dependent receptor [Planctomycetota bacterium]